MKNLNIEEYDNGGSQKRTREEILHALADFTSKDKNFLAAIKQLAREALRLIGKAAEKNIPELNGLNKLEFGSILTAPIGEGLEVKVTMEITRK